jgi:F-type H+-transporting ATPase subunit epsilon
MAEGATIQLEIVTPNGVALSEKVEMLTAPSVDGEFGVLPGHRPLLAALKTGIVTYVKGGSEVKVAVGPGFAEVANDKAVLLTQQFSRKDEVDPVRVRLDLKDADEALDHYAGEPGDASYLDLMQKELWAAAQLTLYGDPPPPTVHTFTESVGSGEKFADESGEGGESEHSAADGTY